MLFFLLTFSNEVRILFSKQGARTLRGTNESGFDKEDKMQRIVEKRENLMIGKQGALVLEKQ